LTNANWTGKNGTNNYSGGIAITYKAKSCEKCGWIQFVWASMGVTRSDGTGGLVSGSTKTPTGILNWTTNGNDKQYGIDTQSTTNPLYEAPDVHGTSFTHIRGVGEDTIYDSPDLAALLTLPKTDGDKPRVVRAQYALHFAAYLYCDGKPVFGVQWFRTQVYSDGKYDPIYTSVGSVGPNVMPNQSQVNALKNTYPNWNGEIPK
jgi:hypothetical protein